MKAKIQDESLPEEDREKAKETLRKDRKKGEEKYRKSLEAAARADPYRWICNFCESEEGTDSVNQHYRENCFRCSRPRPSRNAEKACPRMFLERWVCKECGITGKTYNAQTSECPKCGRKRTDEDETVHLKPRRKEGEQPEEAEQCDEAAAEEDAPPPKKSRR